MRKHRNRPLRSHRRLRTIHTVGARKQAAIPLANGEERDYVPALAIHGTRITVPIAALGLRPTLADLQATIVEGAAKRLRPKFLTMTTTFVGLIPIMWTTGTGPDVWRHRRADAWRLST